MKVSDNKNISVFDTENTEDIPAHFRKFIFSSITRRHNSNKILCSPCDIIMELFHKKNKLHVSDISNHFKKTYGIEGTEQWFLSKLYKLRTRNLIDRVVGKSKLYRKK